MSSYQHGHRPADPVRPSRRNDDIELLAIVNSVLAGASGVYLATRSAPVTAIACAAAALVAAAGVLRRRLYDRSGVGPEKAHTHVTSGPAAGPNNRDARYRGTGVTQKEMSDENR
jgi:hypothetical protein